MIQWDPITQKSVKSKRFTSPYEIEKLSVVEGKDTFAIAFKERDGRKISIWRFSKSEVEKKPQHISVYSYRPGGGHLFVKVKTELFHVNGNYGLVILSEGQGHFRILSLDFERESLVSI